jgi:chitin synthase
MSWGTKGSDKADPLPSVSSTKSKGAEHAVVEDQTPEQADVDAAFKETVTRAITKVVKKEIPKKPTTDDQNKTFRTRLLAFWMLTNAVLVIVIESKGLTADELALQKKQSIYLGVTLYTTLALPFIRFIGVRI